MGGGEIKERRRFGQIGRGVFVCPAEKVASSLARREMIHWGRREEEHKLLAGKLGLHDAADNGVVASGAGYARFGGGTQICWGESAAFSEIKAGDVVQTVCTFAAPFINSDYSCATTFGADGGNSWSLRVSTTVRGTSNLQIFIGSRDVAVGAGTTVRYIAIGRWK